jgi:hypothetical protein
MRHVRGVRPLVFPVGEPEEARVPEGKLHSVLKLWLFQLLWDRFRLAHTIGSDQFLFWNARDPGRRCAPDVYVKLERPDDLLYKSWKTWERGTPELVIEVEGDASGKRLTWEERFERFYEIGLPEVVRYDYEGPPGKRLRVWDRIEDDLVERVVEDETTPCLALGLWWVVREIPNIGAGLRLASDSAGTDLLLSTREQDAMRIAELEGELARRQESAKGSSV